MGTRTADEEELVSLSMERALRELDGVIGHAFGMQDRFTDPSAPERLAADRAVAAAARHAIALTKALKVCSSVRVLQQMGGPMHSQPKMLSCKLPLNR